jgi:hypothetical protein
MSEIHYFPRYSQRENFVTNNTLLLLLRLHDYNRFKFEKYMETLCAIADEEVELPSSWLQFQQQIGTGKSVVDGFIAQDSIKIAIETKMGDTFDLGQIENHLEVFANEQHKLLILLSPSQGELSHQRLEPVRKLSKNRQIQILPLTFHDIIEKAKQCFENDEEMYALLLDYESFCSDENLLPRDSFTLFVPPCAQSYSDNLEFRLYYCPATWSRRKAKYIGLYKDRCVSAIGHVGKIVICNVELDARKVVIPKGTKSITKDEEERILGAAINAKIRNWDLTVGYKFHLFDALEKTDFKKETPYGIMGHRYFDLEEVLGAKPPEDLKELSNLLSQHTWK